MYMSGIGTSLDSDLDLNIRKDTYLVNTLIPKTAFSRFGTSKYVIFEAVFDTKRHYLDRFLGFKPLDIA